MFFEFWAHVLRNPELRGRFAAIRRRSRARMGAAIERVADERGARLPVPATAFTVTMNAAQIGLALERLTDSASVEADLGERVARRRVHPARADFAEDDPEETG